jgi:L-glyceraldehyde 3-phosphate reductase
MSYLPSVNRYTSMIYNYCGKSGLKLPAISLGLWHNFGDVDNFDNSRQILLKAFDAGITHFDLANNYGPPPGSAEKNFGVILKNDLKNYRDELIISTKAGYMMWDGPYGEWGSRKYLIASLDQSLKRMAINYVDIFYSHRPDPDTPLEETMGALDHAVKQGKALYAGISNYNPEQTKKAARILRALGTPCLIHQPKYSMFVREPENKLFDVIEDEGIGSIAFSPLAQGLLTDKYLDGIPEGSRAAKPHGFLRKEEVTADKVERIRKLNDIALKRNQSLAQMAIAWILRDKRVTSVLVGVSSVDQLNDNLKSLDNIKFDPKELKSIDTILE